MPINYLKKRLLEFKKLLHSNECKIKAFIQNSWDSINWNQTEPQIIYQYLTKGVEFLNKKIPPLLNSNGFVIKFAGVFVHQTPIVEPFCSEIELQKRKRCELGDLLTIFVWVDRNKKILYSSAFISQAKKEAKLDNSCQHCLYELSDSFKYFRGTCEYNGQRRFLPPIFYRHLAMNYLILKRNFPCIYEIPFHSQKKQWWGDVIFNLLNIYYGLEFIYLDNISLYLHYFFDFFDHFLNKRISFRIFEFLGWSQIITDLINCTGSKYFKRTYPRGKYLKMFLNKFNQYDKYDKYFIEGEGKNEEGGIPILFIILQDRELVI